MKSARLFNHKLEEYAYQVWLVTHSEKLWKLRTHVDFVRTWPTPQDTADEMTRYIAANFPPLPFPRPGCGMWDVHAGESVVDGI